MVAVTFTAVALGSSVVIGEIFSVGAPLLVVVDVVDDVVAAFSCFFSFRLLLLLFESRRFGANFGIGAVQRESIDFLLDVMGDDSNLSSTLTLFYFFDSSSRLSSSDELDGLYGRTESNVIFEFAVSKIVIFK